MNTPLADVQPAGIWEIISACATTAAAMVAAYYTFVTHRLQRATQRQVEISAQQLAQAKAQFEHEKSELSRRRKQEVVDARPVFRWLPSGHNRIETISKFTNAGGAFFEVKYWRDGSAELTLVPEGIIKADENGSISVRNGMGNTSFPYAFGIEGKTRFDEWIEYRFAIDAPDRAPKQVEMRVLKEATPAQ